MWICIKNKKPKYGVPLITRSPGYHFKSDSFESWRKWKIDILSYNPPITHWWDGEYDFDIAVSSWSKQVISEDSSFVS